MKKWGSHPSPCWGHGGLSEGKTCLKGPLEGVQECTLPCVRPLWECLCLDQEHLINDLPFSCLTLTALEGLCITSEWMVVYPLTLGEAWIYSWLCMDPVDGDPLDIQCCIHDAVGLWCLPTSWFLMMVTGLEMRSEPIEEQVGCSTPGLGPA